MDQPGPDAPQLAPQEQQQPEADYAMEHEDEPILREATDQADHAAHEGDGSGEGNAPVGEAWGHKRLSLFISVNPYISGPGGKSSSPSIKIYHNYVTKMTRKSASRISPSHHAYWGLAKQAWLETFLSLPNGIPS